MQLHTIDGSRNTKEFGLVARQIEARQAGAQLFTAPAVTPMARLVPQQVPTPSL